ncbi:amino acid/polyamine transporter I [Phycomyces nitens]|nr:amino acid/polyamine transporter I [Phycomyces nitens]
MEKSQPQGTQIVMTEKKGDSDIVSSSIEDGSGLDYDAQRLQEFGYKQEFKREISMIVLAGFGFSTMAVLPNWLVGFGASLVAGGPSSLWWTWITVSPFVMCIGLSMAEVISAYPLAGGIYSWCYMLSNEEWGPFTSWVSGYVNLSGMLATSMTLAWSCADFVFEIANIHSGVEISSQGAHVGLYCAMLIAGAFYSYLGLKCSSYLNVFMMYWVLFGTLIVIITIPAMAPTHTSGKWVFTEFINRTGYDNDGMAFLLGLLQAGWCMIGYGAGAQIVEGTKNADKTAPRGIIICVAGSIIQGAALILPVMFSIQDVEELIGSPYPIATFFERATSKPVAIFFMVILLVTQFGALCNNTFAMGQLIWALARDRCIPQANFWYSLDNRKIPVRGLMLQMIICIVAIMPSFGSPVYWQAIMSTAVICVNVSYGLPFVCRLIWKRNTMRKGPFSLGRFSVPLNVISIVWIIFFAVILCLPQKYPVTAETMNWSCVMISAVVIFATVFWFAVGHKTYKGPMQNIST